MRKGLQGGVQELSLRFDDPALPERLEAAREEELFNAPFGLVRMDNDGTVTLYSRREADLSGLSPDATLGRNFFEDVAPCTNNFMVAERFKEEGLDTEIAYVFTYAMEPTEVTLRLIRRPGRLYLLVKQS